MSRRHTSPHIDVGANANGVKHTSPASKSSKGSCSSKKEHVARNDVSPSAKKGTHRRTHSGGGSTSGASSKRVVAVNGASLTDTKNLDFLCPICLDLIIEAHITRCGHTFCFRCISKSVEIFKRCPKCSYIIATCDQIFPNYLLDELIIKFKLKRKMHDNIVRKSVSDVTDGKEGAGDGLKNFLTSESQKLTLPDVNIILGILNQRKQLLEAESTASQNHLLYDFLKHLQFQKKKRKEQIENELSLLEMDMAQVEEVLKDISIECSGIKVVQEDEIKKEDGETVDTETIEKTSNEAEQAKKTDTGNNSSKETPETLAYILRKRRMLAHFDDFVKSYFAIRNRELLTERIDEKSVVPEADSDKAGETDKASETDKKSEDGTLKKKQTPGLDVFRENLVRFSKYGSLHQIAAMNYSSDLQTNSTIVSTIVFDKDAEFFAIGGVTKRIKIYDYMAMVRDDGEMCFPVLEMTSKSKISCLSWNPQNKNVLAASDYNGAVNIWDVQAATQIKSFHEHDRRCWSVDFNDVDARLIASGSDDARVKLWTLNQEHSIATLETKANICCVKFNPVSSCHLAFGSADQDVHYYDLRFLAKPLAVLKGHKKAVSYVKFLNGHEIVSASTDSQLKLWNVHDPPLPLRTFGGHVNERNFVGLATDGDYIACGSEDNAVYVYYKGLSRPLFNFRMDGSSCLTAAAISNSSFMTPARTGHAAAGFSSDSERISEMSEFVSAVCWRYQSNAIVAANSRGIIKVLELV